MIYKLQNGGNVKLQNASKPFESATAKSYFSGLKDYLLHQTKSFTPSLYKPTKGSNIQQQYYTRPGLKEEVVLNLFGGTDSNAKGPLGNYFYKDFDDAYNTLSLANESRAASNGTLGKYGVSAGIDDKGRYISFIDTFDHVFIPGKGIPIYDRIYEDEIESLYNPNLSALNEGDGITRSPILKKRLKHKLNKGGVIKLQNAGTTMPSVEDAILRAGSNQSAKEKAKKQVASEKPKYIYVNPYDYLHGGREATEDAAKQDKYTVENLGGSKEEAEAAYNASKENAAKQLAGTTATGLGTVALLGLSGGAAGPVAADIVNTGFGAHGLYNALSGNGIQKTVRFANQGDTGGAVKSGAGDLLDLSMGLHAAKLGSNLGKSMLAGQSLGNAYRGNVVGRELSNGVRSFNVSKNPLYSNPTVVSTIDHLYKEHPELAAIGPKEAYSQYYKTIFPASKVQIPYAHGTRGNLSKGLEGSTKVSYTAAPETIGRNDFYLNLQPEASLQYADGIGVPEGFTGNKHRFWPLKEILGKPYESDAGMSKPIKLREQIPNRAGQFSRVKNTDGTYSGHGKLLEEYKAELGMQDLSDKEFLQKFGIKDEETFEQWVAENKQKFSDIYNSGDYQGLYHVKVDASNPLTINGGNTYYSERGIGDIMNSGKNDILLHNNAANEFGSDVMVVKDVDPSKVRILGSDPDKQAFANFMNGHNISFTPTPQKPVSTVHFDPRVKPLSRPISEFEKNGRYTLDELHQMGFKLPRKHLQGEDAVKMFKEYGTIEIPENSQIIEQLRKYVPETRERYGLIGNTNITDDEIAGSLYKKVLELGGDTAARNEVGEPVILFRGSTKRNLQLYPKGIGEQQMSGADNILGNLFLGELPGTRKGEGLERYLGVVRDSKHGTEVVPPDTKAAAFTPRWAPEVKEYFPQSRITYNPVEDNLQYLYEWEHPLDGKTKVYKIPAEDMEFEANDINGYVVRTPKVRDATEEISVLTNLSIPKEKQLGETLPLHYRKLIEQAEKEGQGLLVSYPRFKIEPGDRGNKFKDQVVPMFRDEHENFTYYALPNFNIRGAKHILPFDLRMPTQGNSRIVYRKQGGILKAQNGTPSFVTPMTNQFTTKLMEFLEKYRRKGPALQKAVGPAVGAYNKPSKIADDGGKIS